MSGDSERGGGLVPTVVCDIVSGEALMLAYAGMDELSSSRELRAAVFYSRSRGERWVKGSSSGGLIRVFQAVLDCDGDAALYVGYSTRHVCHLGRRSCFHNVLWDVRLEEFRRLLGETAVFTRVTDRGISHPLVTWLPPPSPLLVGLASSLLADLVRERGVVNGVVAPREPPPLLALQVAQRLKVPLYIVDDGGSESLGELDVVALIAAEPGLRRRVEEIVGGRGARILLSVSLAAAKGEDECSLIVVEESDGVLRVDVGECVKSLITQGSRAPG